MAFAKFLLTAGTESIMDSSVVTFVVEGIKEFVGILTTPPLGLFLTVGLLGTVVGLTRTIVRTVRRG